MNIIWDLDDEFEDERNELLDIPRYNMKCNKCFRFLGFVEKPEDLQEDTKFCPKCSQRLFEEE